MIRKFENGEYGKKEKLKPIITKHPNLVRSVLLGKKGWGLWCSEWSQGIGQGLFTKFEIFEQFNELNIKIPDSFLKELDNNIWNIRDKFKLL